MNTGGLPGGGFFSGETAEPDPAPDSQCPAHRGHGRAHGHSNGARNFETAADSNGGKVGFQWHMLRPSVSAASLAHLYLFRNGGFYFGLFFLN